MRRYPGGLQSYVSNAIELLAASKRGDNPLLGFEPKARPVLYFPSNITRDCSPSLLILQGITLLPF